jgi:putative FmdB family regulatory protein
MPMYEFLCAACGERFEELVSVGTESATCPTCATQGAERVLSAQATPFQLVKGPGGTRKQERRNAELGRRTKSEFKERRRRARERSGGGDG